MAAGLAGDVITATCLASTAPVVVAPAMDGEMYAHPSAQANVANLRTFGYSIVEPASGPLASGQVGRGRLAETATIMEAVDRARRHADQAARRDCTPTRQRHFRRADPRPGRLACVVTAGGNGRPIDPVRYIGNRSTGKMGVAIAELPSPVARR